MLINRLHYNIYLFVIYLRISSLLNGPVGDDVNKMLSDIADQKCY